MQADNLSRDASAVVRASKQTPSGALKEQIALVLATLLTVGTLYWVPPWRGLFTDICHFATVCGLVTIAIMWVTRFLGTRGIVIERWVAALFLAGMPVVYVIRWFEMESAGAPHFWLWVEILGIPLYVSLAILGLKRWPWLLALGIAGHGLAWDLWHYLGKSAYVPDWYAIGCLTVDIGLGLYVAARIPAWKNEER